MHDFYYSRYQDIHYEFLKERVCYFKESEGGKEEMNSQTTCIFTKDDYS